MISGWRFRAPIAAAAAVSLAALTLLPAEHIHTSEGHDDDHGPRIHRHFAAHVPGSAATIEDEDDDHEVRWLSTVFTIGKAPVHAAANPAALPLHSTDVPLRPSAWVSAPWRPSSHDPPWRSSLDLRGPPLFSA